jgi:hypothetical protein
MNDLPKNPTHIKYRDLILSELQALNGREVDDYVIEATDDGRDIYGMKRIILELAEIQRAVRDDDIDKEVVFDQIQTIRNFICEYGSEGMPRSIIKKTMDHVNHSIFDLPTFLNRKRVRLQKKMKEAEKTP